METEAVKFTAYNGSYSFESKDTTPEKNEELINKVANSGVDDKDHLAWELAELNYPLVTHMIQKYFGGYSDRDSLISDGIYALYRACMHVKENTPNKMFTTYACQYIYGGIINGVKTRDGVVKRSKIKGVETKAEECSLDNFGYDIEDVYHESQTDRMSSRSDGEFCRDFITDVKDYYIEKKDGHYSTFFSGTTGEILDGLMQFDSQADMVEKCGVSKQRIDQVKQSMFIYTLQTLRDCDDKDRDEMFNILYGGKYSVDNPPPLSGWRKEFWDLIFSTDEYKSHTAYKEEAKNLRKASENHA